VKRSSLGPAFLSSVAIHVGALMVLSLTWGWLRVLSPPVHLDGTELVMVAPIPEPVAPREPVEVAHPPVVTEEATAVPIPPPSPIEPVTPPKVEPIIPPKNIEQPAPKRVEPRPKPLSPPKPQRAKKPPAEMANEATAGSHNAPTAGDTADSKSGPRLPIPDASRETAAGNVLGQAPTQKAEDRPSRR